MARSRWWRLPAVLMAMGLLASACGGDDSGSGGDDGAAAEQEEGDPDSGSTPVYGGKLTFAREAETSSPWTPGAMVCDASCHQAIHTVYDSLTVIGEDGEPHPYLLESIEPNEDFTEWTLVARDGITFHDGTPFDADTIVDHFERMRASFLVGRSLLNVADQQKVDAMTATISMGTPWATFPFYLAGQPGYVASPTWLAAVDAGEADAAEPVGSGPFVFEEYRPGDNLRVVRNDDYWVSDPDGNAYPYLDEIEFVVQEEDLTRERALTSGEVDMTHSDIGKTLVNTRELAEQGQLENYEIDSVGPVTYALINVDAPDSPVGDVRIRRAMAHAVDQEFRNEAREAGAFPIANGPFRPGTVGYLEDTGFPEFDPDKARELVDEYKADTGVDEVRISFNTTADPENLESVQLYQQFLGDVGIEVDIAQIEQGSFITEALNGNFEVFTWRGHGGDEPDTERVWWHSETAQPIGEIALNFGRARDDVIDENLQILRESADPAVRTEAAEAVNRRFGEQVYNIWADWRHWTISNDPSVNGAQTALTMPDGGPASTSTFGSIGVINPAVLWLEGAG